VDFLAQLEAITSGNKQAEVAFICRTGKRSATARDRLEAAGYENVTSVAGGLLGRNGWRKQDLPETSLAQSRCGDGDAATTGQC